MRTLLLLLAVPTLLLGTGPSGAPPPTFSTATVMRRVATSLLAALSGVASLWIAGEALADPGGWKGVGLVATWAVPMVVLSALAWFRPTRAVPVLVAVAGVYAAASVIGVVLHDRLAEFEDRNGPVQLIVLLATVLPVSLLGYHRPRAAGVVLAVMTLLPLVAGLVVGPSGGHAALVIVSVPILLAAALFLTAARERPRT